MCIIGIYLDTLIEKGTIPFYLRTKFRIHQWNGLETGQQIFVRNGQIWTVKRGRNDVMYKPKS